MFILIFNQLLKMLLILFLGILCYKVKLIDQNGNRNLSALLLNVVNPCLILVSYQRDYDPRLTRGLLMAFVFSIAGNGIAILITRIFISQKNNDHYVIDRLGAAYPNCGFMGIPLINSVLGGEGVFYITAYMTIFNILIWTHGLALLKGKVDIKNVISGLKTPVLIVTFAAIVMYFARLRLPGVILDSANYLSDMNTPLAMLIAGVSLAQADFRTLFNDVRIYKDSVLKLLVIPLAVLAFLRAANADYSVAYPMLIAAACPTATIVTLMSIQYGQDYKYASKLFSFTTVLCIVTIPLIIFIASFVL